MFNTVRNIFQQLSAQTLTSSEALLVLAGVDLRDDLERRGVRIEVRGEWR